MQIVGATADDLRMMAQLVNLVQAGSYTFGGKDMCAAADAIRWLQKLAVTSGKAYAEAPTTQPPPEEPKAQAPGFPEGVTMKAFNPGKPGKK